MRRDTTYDTEDDLPEPELRLLGSEKPRRRRPSPPCTAAINRILEGRDAPCSDRDAHWTVTMPWLGAPS